MNMKNFILSFIVLVSLAACNQKSNDSARNIELLSDSSSFSNQNIYSDTAVTVQNLPIEEHISVAPKKKVTVQRNYKKAVSSGHVAVVPTVSNVPVKAEVPTVSTPPIVSSPTVENKGDQTVSTGNSTQSGIPGDSQVQKKKGWSKAAQGAVIGGAAGAVGGAILSKKKGLGAVVGGIVGAAGGYIIGKNKDKRDASKNDFE